jgi:cellulose synthase (UDP-forming)
VLNIDPKNTSAAVGLEELRVSITPSVKQITLSVMLVAMVIVLLRMSARWPGAARLNVLLVLGIGAWYLWWRATQTLVTDSPALAVISVGLFVAECYGYLALLFFYIQTWSPIYREAPPPMDPQALPAVDIYVTIFDEPMEVLYRTLVGCRAIRYPDEKKKIYVLDDGHRTAVREVAERLGCQYVCRPTHEHAKAGNLNYALKHTGGEIILNFDTDHVPVSTYLERTIGYFRDPQIALVQTAHHFYNPDPYQDNLRLTTEVIHEQELFFQVIQPGRDHYNAAFFCGSGGLFRRSALEAIGGFLTATTTEDIHTSIRLHAKGYRSVYVSERLAAGLSPESLNSYLKQRDRWAQGHAQILFTRENPLWAGGLTFMQRINYLASISYYFLGIPRILYLLAPLFYLLFGTPPLVANIWMLAAYYVPYYVASLLVFNVVSGGRRNPFWSDVYEAAVCFAVTVATARAFIYPRRTAFYVTPKGVRRQKSVVEKEMFPQAVLSGALVAGMVWGAYDYFTGPTNTHAVIISFIWAGYNLILLMGAVVVAHQRPQLRGAPRLIRRLPCQLRYNGHAIESTVLDLSETGMSLTMSRAVHLPSPVEVTIRGTVQERTTVRARVVRNDRDDTGRIFIGLEFLDLNEDQHQSIVRQMYSDPQAWRAGVSPAVGFWPSFTLLLTSGLRAFFHEVAIRRLSPRVRKELRCDLLMNGQRLKGLTEDIGLNGLSVRLKDRLAGGKLPRPGPVQLVLYPGNGHEIGCGGEIVWTRPDRVWPTVGILLVRYDPQELEKIMQA